MNTRSDILIAPPDALMPATLEAPDKAHDAVIRHATGVAVLLAFAAVLLWLRGTDLVPGGDVGGYVQMLRHFLATGRVDYMKWCQPTFIGLLPIAAPWGLAFGTGMGSLSLIGIAYAIGLIIGFYLLVSRHTSPFVAALLCASLACFAEFLPCASSFMTDIPYAAYFVWFVLAHDLLLDERRHEVGRGVGPWALWGVSFLLAALTRPFIFVAIPVFFMQWMLAAGWRRKLYRTCAIVSTVLALLSFLFIALLGDNRFGPIEQTSLREVFVLHQYGRFNVQTTLLSLLSTGVMALPALLLSAQARKIRPSIGDACVAAAGLVVGVYYWRRGMFPSVLPLVNPGALKVVTLIQVLGASIGWVVVYRLLRESVRGGRSSAAPMLAVVIVAQFAAMPIMQHPLLRHAMPAFVALVALVAIIGIRSALPTRVIAAVLIAAMGFSNAQMTRHTAQVDEAAWQLSGELTKSGVPLEQLDGGWGWFCYYHLHPGLPDTRGYRARYYELRDHARYSVGARPPAPGEIAVHEVNVPAPLFGPSTKIVAVDRMPANNLPTN